MTLVLEESEDISFELMSPILASVKKDNQVLRDGSVCFILFILVEVSLVILNEVLVFAGSFAYRSEIGQESI